MLVKDFRPGYLDGGGGPGTVAGGLLYFKADDGVHGTELWKSDGTTEGTVLVKDQTPWGSDTRIHVRDAQGIIQQLIVRSWRQLYD